MNCKLIFTLLVFPAMVLRAAPGVETVFLPVAVTGQPAPGLSTNVKFSSFKYVSLANNGTLAFTATLTGPGITSTNNLGFWAGVPGDLQLLLRTGDPATNYPAGMTNGDYYTYFWQPNVDDSGAVGMIATTHSCPRCEALYFGSFIYFEFRPSDEKLPAEEPKLPQPSIPSEPISNALLGHVINAMAGRMDLGGSGIGSSNNAAIMAGPPTNFVIVAQTGSPSPGGQGNFQSFDLSSQRLALTEDGRVAFIANASSGQGIWFGTAGDLLPVALSGKAAPASLLGAGYSFSLIGDNVEVNRQGQIAFCASLSGPGINTSNYNFVIAGPTNALRVVAQSGQPAPGIPGATFHGFYSGGPAFNDVMLGPDGTVVFCGYFGTNNYDFGLWLAPTNGSTPILLMYNGQQAPGAPAGAVFTNVFQYLPPFQQAYMNAANQVMFRAFISGPGTGPNDYGVWLAQPDGTVNLIARTGDPVDVGGGNNQQIADIYFGDDPETIASPEDGRRKPINNLGEALLIFGFTNYPSALFVARTGIILAGNRVGTNYQVQFPTLSGKHYRVDFKTNLNAAVWSVLYPSVTGTGNTTTVTNFGGVTTTNRYFRVVRTD